MLDPAHLDVRVRVRECERHVGGLLDELSDRFKNNMQMLHSLLRAAQRETPSAEVRAVLAVVGQRVGAMSAAQQVLNEADDPVKYQAKNLLDAVSASARQALGKHGHVLVEAVDGELSNDTAMRVALLVN